MKRFSMSVMLLCLCCGGKQEPTKSAAPETKTPPIVKSVLMVIAPNDFRDEEFKAPYDLFTESGMKVTIASTATRPAKGMRGMVVKPEIELEQVVPDSFDALVVVGGSGAQVLWDNTTLHRIVRNFNNAKKIIAAICIAPVVLARAGILKDTKATVSSSVKDEITKEGSLYTGANVEISGHIITGSGPQAAKDFARAIFNKLSQ